ncbi:hypothetical protein [Aeromonas salmonicida]|nr:hypothetical protein [Aeromonas salmonicida]
MARQSEPSLLEGEHTTEVPLLGVQTEFLHESGKKLQIEALQLW